MEGEIGLRIKSSCSVITEAEVQILALSFKDVITLGQLLTSSCLNFSTDNYEVSVVPISCDCSHQVQQIT